MHDMSNMVKNMTRNYSHKSDSISWFVPDILLLMWLFNILINTKLHNSSCFGKYVFQLVIFIANELVWSYGMTKILNHDIMTKTLWILEMLLSNCAQLGHYIFITVQTAPVIYINLESPQNLSQKGTICQCPMKCRIGNGLLVKGVLG